LNSEGGYRGIHLGAGAFALVVVLSAIFFVASRPAIDPDYGWHVANGRHIADGALFAGRDVYSWTASGSRWIAHEWLTDAAMSAAHKRGGPTVNSILAAVIVTAAFALVATRLRTRGFTWGATVSTVALAFLSSVMSLGVRPQVLELLYLAATLLFIDSWVRGAISTVWLYVGAAAGSVLWANTHGSFPLFCATLAALSAGLWVARDERWLGAAFSAVIALVAALANPWGWELYAFATQSVTSQSTLEGIQEWRSPELISGSLIPFDAALMLIVCAVPATIRQLLRSRAGKLRQSLRGDEGRGVPMIYDLIITIPIVLLGLQSGRHVMLAGVCGAPLIAWSIDRALNLIGSKIRPNVERPAQASRADVKARNYINAAASAAVAIALAFQAWRMISPEAQRVALSSRYPAGAVASLEKLNPPVARLFNQYDWGGYVIERGRTKVFIDGRSEVYGDEQLDRYGSIVHLRPRWSETLDSLGVDYLLMPRTAPLVAALRKKGWTEIARDSVGSLLKHPRGGTFLRSQANPQP
jgi:hypothetical protein